MAQTNTLQDWLTWSFSPSISAIIVALLVSTLLPIIIHSYLYRKASSKQLPSFLLVGPSGAGKTSLLSLFANGTIASTHTSQEPQTALCRLPSTTRSSEDRYRSENDTSSLVQPQFNLVDTPGHGKLRRHAVSSLDTCTNLKGLLFVVDSATVSSVAGLTETAEFLYDILLLLQKRHTNAKSSRDPQGIPVLLVANKQDVFTSLPAPLVKTKLEAEVAKVRLTRSRRLLDSGVGKDDEIAGKDDDEEANWLGEYGSSTFTLAQMQEYGVEVQVIGGNVKGEGNSAGKVDDWWAWIGDNL